MSIEFINSQNKLNSEDKTSFENILKANINSENQKILKNIIPFTKKWRVKLYILDDNGQWDDKGIGYVFCANQTEEETVNNGGKQNSNQLTKKLIMLNEETEEIIFNINMEKDNIDFHNQRKTIITWKKGGSLSEDNNAISFQEKEGVIEILKNIKMINGSGNTISDDELLKDESSDIYLEATNDNLPNLVREFGPNMDEQKLSDFIEYLKETDCEFIKKLGKILDEEENKNEDGKSYSSFKTNSTLNIKKEKEIYNSSDKHTNKKIKNNSVLNENINYIFTLFKNLISIADKELLELLFDDECYLITFGALENDIQSNKIVPHRKYFKEIVKFKNPLNINDEFLLQKINQNLRLTYLRDTAFSRLIDDNTNRIINTMIQMNHNDIIQYFINNKEYLEILFSQLKSEDIIIQKDAILFLSELIVCSKNVVQSRITFNEILCENGILPILSNLIETNTKNIVNNENNKEKEMININTVEIFISILSAVPLLVRQYLKENDGQMLDHLTNLLLYHNNFGVKYEISQIFKTLIENNGESYNKNKFFNSSIDKFINFLNSPILENKNDLSSTIQIIIEIFITWFNNNGFDSQIWIDKYKINLIIIKLLKEKNKIINLYVIKLLRIIIENSQHYICIKIFTNELCNLLINLFNENKKKNNIITSCLMSFFNSISQDHIYILNIIMNYSSDFFYNNKDYFSNLILRYERKPTPKKKLLSYLNINTITEYNLKDIEPIYNTNLDNYKENNEIMDDFLEDNLLKEDNDDDSINLINKSDNIFSFGNNNGNRVGLLSRKRHFDKYIEDEVKDDYFNDNEIEIEPLNKRLNNFGKHFYKDINYFSHEKYKRGQYVGMSLKEGEEDEFYKNYDDEDLFK